MPWARKWASVDVAGLVLEHVDEHMADAAAFLLRIADALQGVEEALAGIDDVQVGLEMVA